MAAPAAGDEGIGDGLGKRQGGAETRESRSSATETCASSESTVTDVPTTPPPTPPAPATAPLAALLTPQDLVLSVGVAILCLLLDESGAVGAAAAGAAAAAAAAWHEDYNEDARPLGRWLLFDLEAAEPDDPQPAHQLLAEIVATLGLLHVRLDFDEVVLIKVLRLVERCVRAGIPLRRHTLRPLLLTAAIIASKEHYDESMSLKDMRTAMPHLDLGGLGAMELAMLQLLDWRTTVWDDDEWRAYRAGLQGLLQEQRAELASFTIRYSPTINAIVDAQLLLPPPAA